MSPPLLEMRGIVKSFPGVRAVRGVDLVLQAGEVLALVGENGAGKSTLMKILGGALVPDAGAIFVNGVRASIHTPASARRAGIAVMYQELNLVPGLTAAENIFLGSEPTRIGLIRKGEEARKARALLDRIGMAVDPAARCRELSIPRQQAVEIARALAAEAPILIMDEPSATLTPPEVAQLLAVVRELKSQRIGVIYISHRLDEVFDLADRVMILRDGEHVGTYPVGNVSRGQLINLMVGRRLDQEFPRRESKVGAHRLVVKDLRRGGQVRGVSLSVRRGEVVGLTGLVGSGRTETARLIFGADRRDSGTIELDGRPLDIRRPRDAIQAGIGLLTEDRKAEGLVLKHSVRANFSLPNLAAFSRLGFVDRHRERAALESFIRALRIKIHNAEAPARNLSGGNQQKVVLAKWLQRCCEVVIFDEPTRGVDVGARYELYLAINELASAGKAVLLISSEMPEVLGMSDRVLVMHQGRISGEIIDVSSATQEDVLRLAMG